MGVNRYILAKHQFSSAEKNAGYFDEPLLGAIQSSDTKV